jgi:hypothetical protein
MITANRDLAPREITLPVTAGSDAYNTVKRNCLTLPGITRGSTDSLRNVSLGNRFSHSTNPLMEVRK